MNEPIDWPARLERAQAHVERLKAEWAEAAKQRRPSRWVSYNYKDDLAQQKAKKP